MRISKTSLNGILAFLIAAVPLAQSMPELHIRAFYLAWASFAAGLARLWVGLAQTDADLVKVATPQGVVDAPAHPVPDDKGLQDKPVVKD